ncbi:zinc ribbon domain-containing protein [Micromonospora sp. ALFpr18c]|uniref:zinc ribbon domain-containing protein n=1 Tax=Micromonospora sp. ALFpr18c TaxID=1458665 RepID=UPI00124B3CBE|nr:zinc ribbon domain-containing protein [Micromonospora sp. ALFpr18c]KAB1943181.1 zinc ribbon domain-containing protein [Micromonospora sp. ALFpr18c]
MSTQLDAPASCPSCAAPARAGARFCRACGAELSSAGPLVPAPRTGEHDQVAARPRIRSATWRRWLPGRRLRLILAGAVVVVLLVGYGVTSLIAAGNGPDDRVRDLFAALADRDGVQLGKVADCDGSAMCQPASLRQGYQPPEQVEIRSVAYGDPAAGDTTRRPNRNRATVSVRYQVGGQAHDQAVTLTRDGRGLLRSWRVLDPPGALMDVISATVPTARLAGAEVATVRAPAADDRSDGAVWAPPGVYTLAAVDTPLVAAVPSTVVVAADRQAATVDVTVRPEVVDAVTGQVRERIDACARQPDLQPDTGSGPLSNCPLGVTTRYAFTRDARWAVLEYPRVELRQDDAGAVTVRTVTPGRARVTYSYTLDVVEPRSWTSTAETLDITVGGAVAVDSGRIVWAG